MEMKILSVDDNQDNLDLIRDILDADHTVIDAPDGPSCLRLAEEENPHLILLDVQMPFMSGYEVLKLLKENDKTRNIPVIFLSARYRDPDRIVKGLELGAFDYLIKPVDDEILVAKIGVVERLRRAEEAISEQQLKLEQANLRLEHADRAKSNFLAMMSHEIRTPLNAILGFADLLAQSEVNEEQRDQLQIISRSGRNLLELINNILDYSKIESRGIELETTSFNLEHTILEALELVLGKAKEKNIALNFNIEDDSEGYFFGDPHRLRQIVLNLTNNAVKFTSEGEVRVNIGTRPLENEKWEVGVSVEDTGIGIPEENLNRLFKPFSQGDSSTTRRFGGTGLGLVICKRLVEKMGGEIGVESREGEGSTFHFSIPFKGTSENETIADHVQDNQIDESFGRERPMRILAVENDPANQVFIMDILKKAGYSSDLAEDGPQALEMVRNNDYDLMLLDVQMGELDGISITRKIREGACGEASKGLFIIAVTAYSSKKDRDNCLAAEMNDYLSKPISIGQLKDSLARAYERVAET